MSDATEMERLLGAPVLQGRRDLHVFIDRPSVQVTYYQAYARFDGTPDEFAALCKALALGARGSVQAGGHLPAAWQGSRAVSLPWWNPSAGTPENAAARSHGVNGWVVAKEEGGRIYLVVTDAGRP